MPRIMPEPRYFLVPSTEEDAAPMKLHRDLGIRQKSAWHLAHRIREASTKMNGNRQFGGPVEADESYSGERERNRHASKRLRTGCGAVGRTVVIGAWNRNSNAMVAKAVGNTGKTTVRGCVRGHAAPGATVYSDRHKSRGGMLFDDEAIDHRAGECIRGHAHARGIETFLSTMKRGYKRICHKMDPRTLEPLCRRVRVPSRRPGVRHHRLDGRDRVRYGGQAAPLSAPDRGQRAVERGAVMTEPTKPRYVLTRAEAQQLRALGRVREVRVEMEPDPYLRSQRAEVADAEIARAEEVLKAEPQTEEGGE